MIELSQSPQRVQRYAKTNEARKGADAELSQNTETASITEESTGSNQHSPTLLNVDATSNMSPSRENEKLVTWEIDDLENPKNWSNLQKWTTILTVSCFALIPPVSSAMTAPALPQISATLEITNEFESQLTLSIFILGFAFGPLIFAPLSEVYGRVITLQLSNLFFLFFNVGCGVCSSKVQMIIFRFLGGLGGSAPLAVGGAVLGDTFNAKDRGKALAIYSLAPLLGPAIGPMIGGLLAERSWRWIFHTVSILDAVIMIASFFLLRETYAPILLAKKANKVREETGDSAWHTEFENPAHITHIIGTSLMRPMLMLGTQPIVLALAVYTAYLYGLMYLILSTFPRLWTSPQHYNESTVIGSLNYISLGVGLAIGAQVCAPLMDYIYRVLSARNNGIGKPQFRIPLLGIGVTIIPAGIFIYGWTAQYTMHWISPNIGAALFTSGCIACFQSIQAYILDSFSLYTASALAAIVVLRSLAGFGFPLFAPYLFEKLDYGWGSSLLGFIATSIGFPAVAVLWKCGDRLLARNQERFEKSN